MRTDSRRRALAGSVRIGLLSALTLFLLLALSSARAEEPGSPAPVDSVAAPPDVDATPEMPDEAREPAPAAADTAVVPPAAPMAVSTARPQAVRKVRLHVSDENVVRTGPGDGFAIAAVHPRGAEFPVVAKSGDWYNVRLSETETGWIHASLCREFDDLSDLEFKPNPKLFTRTGSFFLTGYGGAYAYDRKSNSLVLGGRLGYYVFDRLQVEGGVAWTHIRRPREIVEELFGLSLEAEDFHMLFYHLIATYELLPGRQMVPFVSGGVGSSIMLGETEPSWNVGAGTTLFFNKRTSMKWEFRHYRFQSGSDNARVDNSNIEFTLGTAYLF